MPMGFYMFHPADLLLIPAILFALWAQARVRGAYAKYSKVGVRAGLTGADVARFILRDQSTSVAQAGGKAALSEVVNLECIPGEMTDHYDPRDKTLRLSEGVYHGRSIAALGIAAHEVGHALQDADNYAPMQLRQLMYPASSIGSTLAFPLIFGGLILGYMGYAVPWLITAGIWLFAAAVAFTIVTLPVEFNASRRALLALANGRYLTEEELDGARAVLSAAALTYVAAAAAAILQLIRLILITQRRN